MSSKMNYEDVLNKLSLIEKEIFNPSSDLYLDNLLDLASAISYDIHCSGTMKNSKPIKAFLDRFSNFSDKIYSMRVSLNDFSTIKTVGQGGFGRVDLVRHKHTKNIYAMKIMDKSTFVQNSFNGFWEERDIMAKNSSDWLIKCFYTFMDLKKLYIVMEYMPGGDLYHWMTELEDFSDEQTHFYAMEMVLAIEVLHKMGFIHRDLKPDNMLLDKNGHMKLADFGTCIRTTNGKVKTNFQVGTPDYISPEILRNTGIHDLEVGFEIDWWAFGIVIYELFYGETPFEGESTSTLYQNIMRYKSTLSYPDDKPAIPEFIDFLSKILTEPSERMDITKVKAHPYLTSSEYKWNFDNIRNYQSPIIFEVSGEDDTNYINYDPNDKRNNISNTFNNNNFFSGENLAFTGFTFNRYGTYNSLTEARSNGMKSISTMGINGNHLSTVTELETKLSEIELAKQQLSLKLESTTNELNKTQQKLVNAENDLKKKEELINSNKSEYEISLESNKLLKSKIDSLSKQIETSQREIDHLKVGVTEKENSIKSLKEENLKLTDEISNTKIKLETTKQNLVKITEELDDKNTQIENWKTIETLFDEEKSKNLSLVNEINSKTRKINEYELHLELINNRSKELQSEEIKSNHSQSKIDELELFEKEKQNLEARLMTMMSDLSHMEEAKYTVQQDLSSEKTKRLELEKIRDKLSKDINNQKVTVANLQAKLNAAEDQKRVLKQRINVIESEKDQIEQQKKMFESMVEVRKAEHDEIVAELEEQEELNLEKEKKFEIEKSNLQGKLTGFITENENMRKEINEKKKKLEDLDLLEMENAHYSQTIEKLKVELEEKREKMMEINQTNMSLNNDLEKSQKELQSDKLKIASLVTKINEVMTNPTSQMNSRKTKKANANNDLGRKVKQLETDLTKERQKFQEKVKECTEIRNDCQDWQDKYKELKAQLDNQNNIIKGLRADLSNRGLRNELPEKSELKSLEGKLEMLKKSKGRHKIHWLPYFGNLKPFKLDIYQNENDNIPLISIDLRSVIHIREPSAAECVHVDKALLPQIIQIIYEKQDTVEDLRRQSVISVDVSRRKAATLTVDDANSSMRSSYIADSGPNGIYNIENHSFVPMRFRSYTNCDLCHQSCSELLNPPLALECANCKKHIHFEHIQNNDYKIQWCQGAIEVVLLKVESKEARKVWINCLNELKDYQKSNEVQVAPNTYYRSVRAPGRHSPAV